MDINEAGFESVKWIHLAQNRPMVCTCEKDNEPLGSTEDEFVDQLSDY
jgi:hypothetical protein